MSLFIYFFVHYYIPYYVCVGLDTWHSTFDKRTILWSQFSFYLYMHVGIELRLSGLLGRQLYLLNPLISPGILLFKLINKPILNSLETNWNSYLNP